MPDTPSITIVKSFTWKGAVEEWSNTYHFTGTTPASETAWKALGDAIWNSEKTIVGPGHKIAKYYGYEAGNEHSVYQLDFAAAGLAQSTGTLSLADGVQQFSGDQAAWIRAKIGTSSKGKNVYIRKYFHGGATQSVTQPDLLSSVYRTALLAHGAKLVDGTLPGSFKWSGPQGQTAGAVQAGTYVTTRTLKRRGKRP